VFAAPVGVAGLAMLANGWLYRTHGDARASRA